MQEYRSTFSEAERAQRRAQRAEARQKKVRARRRRLLLQLLPVGVVAIALGVLLSASTSRE